MKQTFTEEFLRKHWGSEEKIIYKGKKYVVGKMSYGDYFFEPANSRRGEKEGFDTETLWLVKNEDNKNLYEVED